MGFKFWSSWGPGGRKPKSPYYGGFLFIMLKFDIVVVYFRGLISGFIFLFRINFRTNYLNSPPKFHKKSPPPEKIGFTSVKKQNALIIDDFFSNCALKSDFFCRQTAPIMDHFFDHFSNYALKSVDFLAMGFATQISTFFNPKLNS